jgi:DNA-directed RNA polymerase I subunit RPA2
MHCGGILSPVAKPPAVSGLSQGMIAGVQTGTGSSPTVICRMCDNSSSGIERVAMPYVFRYLAAELAAMNIKVTVGVK